MSPLKYLDDTTERSSRWCLEHFSTILTEQETKEKPTLLKTHRKKLISGAS